MSNDYCNQSIKTKTLDVTKMSYSDLPLLNELLKPHACKPRKTLPCECQHIEKINHKPSRGLENWKTWMERRKKIHLKLADLAQRDPGELVMNHAEEYRKVVERRLVMERIKLVEHTDAIIPAQEYISVPDEIIWEKDVYPEKRSITTWEDCPYYKNKCKTFSFELQVIEPHRPDLRELCVLGYSLPKDEVEEKHNEVTTLPLRVEPLISMTKNLKVCLSINGSTFTPSVKKMLTQKVYVFFDYDITTNKADTQNLSLQNTGNTAVHYSWEPVKIIPLFKDILPEKPGTTYFFFNKNKGVVIPQQSINLPIWFNVRTPGVYSETWEFRTAPKIVSGSSKILVVFHASAVIGDIEQKMQHIRDKLDANMRQRLIKETLASILSKLPYEKIKPTIYCYNKKEVFEAVTTTYDPTVNLPKYVYNKDVIRELQTFYKKVRRPTDPKNWNYSIHELRILTNAKERMDDNIEFIKNQRIVKKLKSASLVYPKLEIPKIKFPNMVSDSKSQTHRLEAIAKMDQLRKQLRSNTVSLNDELNQILSKLEFRNSDSNPALDAYKKVYLLLCTCFNNIENEIENLKRKMCIDKKTNYPQIHRSSQFCQYEILIDRFAKPNLIENTFDCRYKPADERLQELPVQECSLRHNTYFKLSDAPVRKKDLPKSKTKKTSDKASKKIKTPKTNEHHTREMYDPYAKVDLISVQDISQTSEILERTPIEQPDNIQVIMEHYKYYIYVIIYHYLRETIESIVDMFEMYSFKKTSPAIIKEIEEPNYIKRLVDLKSLIVEENMDNLKAKMLVHNYRKQSKLNWKAIETQRELRRVKSCSSLWSILRSYEKPRLYEEKPISYPENIYEDEADKIEKQFIHRATSTPGGELGVREEFKDVSLQKEYKSDDEVDDLEAYVEKIKSETSIHSLVDLTFEKGTQKEVESHASDENYFYYSLSDSELSDISIDSQQNEVDDDLEQPLICECIK